MLKILKRSKPLQIGFIPEADCAPIVVAHELGLFEKYGLTVELRRELSWRGVQDRISGRQLDAGHAPATLPFLMNLGLTPEKCPAVTGLVLSLQGNAITVSRQLWDCGVRDAESLGRHIMRDKRTYTFGVGFPLGPQYSLLCKWLKSAEIPYGIKVRIEPAAGPHMFPLLKMGYLDGYCVGEPWNSLAILAGIGACVATSAQLAPYHPEKVLLVRKDYSEMQPEEHQRLIAALLEACEFCDQPENQRSICKLLSLRHYVNAPLECLEAGLIKTPGESSGSVQALHGAAIFHRCRANDPTAEKAAWITGRLYELLRWEARPAALRNVFRRNAFLRAQAMVARSRRSRSADPPRTARSLSCLR